MDATNPFQLSGWELRLGCPCTDDFRITPSGKLTNMSQTLSNERKLAQDMQSCPLSIDIECNGVMQCQGGLACKGHSSGVPPAESATCRTQNDNIAIVGMAGRFPDATDAQKFWDLLEAGLDVQQRFNVTSAYSGKDQDNVRTPYGCFIDEPGLFDSHLFNMSTCEAAQMDPMSRMALATAYEALEMSGYKTDAAENVGAHFATRRVRRSASSRINYYCKFSGPSCSVDTACSSSHVAMELACTSLWAGDCDTACAGGFNVLTSHDILYSFCNGQFLRSLNEKASRLLETFITQGTQLITSIKNLRDLITSKDYTYSLSRDRLSKHTSATETSTTTARGDGSPTENKGKILPARHGSRQILHLSIF